MPYTPITQCQASILLIHCQRNQHKEYFTDCRILLGTIQCTWFPILQVRHVHIIILIHCKRTVSCTACNTYWGTSHPHTIQAQSALPVSHCQAHLILYPMYIAHIFILIHYKCNQLIVSYYTACNTLSGTHHPYIWCLTLLVVKYHKHLYTAGIYRFTYILYHIHTLIQYITTNAIQCPTLLLPQTHAVLQTKLNTAQLFIANTR